MAEPFIEIQGLSKVYKTPAGDFQALDEVNICFDRGELVGEEFGDCVSVFSTAADTNGD